MSDREEILKRLTELIEVQKMTTTEAGAVLGLTKNQVIGMRYRAKLKAERDATLGVTVGEAQGGAEAHAEGDGHKLSAVVTERRYDSLARPANVPPKVVFHKDVPAAALDAPAGKIGIAELDPRHCKFICDDGYFCGQDHKPGSVYCAEHHAVCYTKPIIIHRRKQACLNSAPKPWKLSVGLTGR